jgi:hypothetical protein
MANLRGGNFDKQIKDATHRMGKLGQKKDGENNTHSKNIQDKRVSQLNDFKNYLNQNKLDGKLNTHLNDNTIKDFLKDRTRDLKSNSSETYIRGFSSMVKGLSDNNITTDVTRKTFNDLVIDIKLNSDNSFDKNRSIGDKEGLTNAMYEKHFNSGVMSQIQFELGYRVSEAHELIQNPDKYINDNSVTGLKGKGGREYKEKQISSELIQKIESIEKNSSISQYQKDLQEEGVKSHDLRITYAAALRDNLGLSNKEISEELNHSREEITVYYLARA